MSRDEAIEAGQRAAKRVLTHATAEGDLNEYLVDGGTDSDLRRMATEVAVAVIDAALPHLVPALKAEGLREWAKEIREWYPEGIFIPPTRERLREVHEYLVSTGGTLDAIAAHVMRIAADSAERSADLTERGEA